MLKQLEKEAEEDEEIRCKQEANNDNDDNEHTIICYTNVGNDVKWTWTWKYNDYDMVQHGNMPGDLRQ